MSSHSSSNTSAILPTLKILSTIGLGLIAGSSIASPFLLSPTLFAHSTPLPTHSNTTTASPTSGLSSTHSSYASSLMTSGRILSTSSLTIAGLLATITFLSPPRARHPYLPYSSFLSLLTALSSHYVTRQVLRLEKMVGDEEGGPVNGEVMSERVEWIRNLGVGSLGVAVLAFGCSVVGNYGDFY